MGCHEIQQIGWQWAGRISPRLAGSPGWQHRVADTSDDGTQPSGRFPRSLRGCADPELLRPVLELSATYLGAAFEEADRQYGSFGRFLGYGLEVSEAMLAVTTLKSGSLTME